ncbi:MAG: hypothetical protein H8E66_27180 [Planctomycetes bacterium]|nr:hypothetical protein [Planctomycetota bacterium]
MFGFLRPTCQTTIYRQVYARCCQYQRHHYGLLSLPFLSYEAVLLYLLGIDSGTFPPPDANAPTCCRLRSKVGLNQLDEAPLGEFCASFGLLLAAIKLEDDARDGAGPASSLANWMLRRRFEVARSYFETLDPQFAASVRTHIDDHLDLEQTEIEQSVGDYSEPTANAFGYVFGLLGGVRDMSQHRPALAAVGEQVGHAIIAFDCAVDWSRDRRRGDFNPLPDELSVTNSFRYCVARLRTAAQICRFNFGQLALSSNVLTSVARRVEKRINSSATTCASLGPRQQLAASGSVYTFMDFGLLGVIDGCCEIAACCEVASCCDAGALGGETACGFAECCLVSGDSGSHVACTQCCDPGCCCCDPCCATNNKKKRNGNLSSADASPTKLAPIDEPAWELEIGMWGVARTPLRPTGQGIFDDRILDVATEGEFVSAAARIQIVDIFRDRVVVRAI